MSAASRRVDEISFVEFAGCGSLSSRDELWVVSVKTAGYWLFAFSFWRAAKDEIMQCVTNLIVGDDHWLLHIP